MADHIKITQNGSCAINVQLYDADGNPIYLDDITARMDTIITLLTAIAQGGGITVPTNTRTTEDGTVRVEEDGTVRTGE